MTRPLTPGIYAPLPTFFQQGTEDLDIPTFKKHVVHIAQTGVGVLVCGSMGEAHHLSPEERVELIKAARAALDEAGLTSAPIIAGTGVGSTRETIELTKQAAAAGADYSIVIPSGYFSGAFGPQALRQFFEDVSSASPIPVMVYNYPAAAGGIDMDSDLIESMAAQQNNLCGVKLTCGNVGKLTRIAATVSTPAFEREHPRKQKDAPFLVLGGFADFILPSAFVNGHGAIIGLANVAPNTVHRLFTLSNKATSDPSALAEAQEIQAIVARGDRTIALTGIAGTKWLLQKTLGYGGAPRLPLSSFEEAAGEKLWAHPHVIDLIQLEARLSGKTAARSAVQEASTASASASEEVPSSVTSPTSSSAEATVNGKSPAAKSKHSKGSSITAGVRSFFGSIKRSGGAK